MQMSILIKVSFFLEFNLENLNTILGFLFLAFYIEDYRNYRSGHVGCFEACLIDEDPEALRLNYMRVHVSVDSKLRASYRVIDVS